MAESKIERVARAISRASAHILPGDTHRSVELRAACAAIEAMHGPTDAMVDAGTERDDGADPTNAIGVFTAMLDAALNEQVSG